MASVLILNGPNLNMLGLRQPEIYGATTLKDIEAQCQATAQELGITLAFHQDNSEGAIVDRIQAARDTQDGIILNAGAYTHTSVAIMDALLAAERPVIELHLSNIHAREPFRAQSYISKVAFGIICGFGPAGYPMALRAMAERLGL